jgi:hypothetical protein
MKMWLMGVIMAGDGAEDKAGKPSPQGNRFKIKLGRNPTVNPFPERRVRLGEGLQDSLGGGVG